MAGGVWRGGGSAAAAQEKKGHGELEALAWLEGTWVAEDSKTAPQRMTRESHYEWGKNGRSLHFWSFVEVADGRRFPYVDGFYGWHPVEKRIRFWYFDPTGYYEGEVQVDGKRLEHVFTGFSADGSSKRWRYWLENAGEDKMPTKIFESKDGDWQEMVGLVYEKR